MAQARKKGGKKKKKAASRPAKKKTVAGKKQQKKKAKKKVQKKTTATKSAGKKPSKKKSVRKKAPVKKKKPAEKATPRPVTNRARIGTFEELIANHMPEVQETARRLRSIVHDVLPKAVETVYLGWRIAIYREPREICGIQPVRGRCNFYLTDGAHLPDPERLLQGTGKNIRHVRIFEPKGIPLAPLKQLIREGHRFARLGRPVPDETDEQPGGAD